MRALVVASAFAWAVLLGAPAGADAAPPGRRAHLLVVIDLSGPEARVLRASVVERALPRGGPARGWEVVVEDARGRALHRARTPAGGTLRGERVVDGRVEAIAAPDPRAAIAVRVPILANAAAIRLLARAAGPPAAPGPRTPAGSRLEERAAPEVEVARVPYPRVAP